MLAVHVHTSHSNRINPKENSRSRRKNYISLMYTYIHSWKCHHKKKKISKKTEEGISHSIA